MERHRGRGFVGFAFASRAGAWVLCAGIVLASVRCGGNSESSNGDPPSNECSVTGGPKETPTCVNEAYGFFVSPNGSDANDGSRGKPFKTLGKALLNIGNVRRALYLCEGQYAETIKLTTNTALFGGFSCADWSYNGRHAVIGLGDATALTVVAAGTVSIVDVDFVSADAVASGASSIAGIVSDTRIALRRTTFAAGAGKAGTDGVSPPPHFLPERAPDSNHHVGSIGATGSTNSACGSYGGVGGGSTPGSPTPQFPPGFGEPSIRPELPLNSGFTGTPTGKIGNAGSFGAGGLSGLGARSWGRLSVAGWQTESGKDGIAGAIAQGGAGGRGQIGPAVGGGSGASGGCGGAPGLGGMGGGASMALVLVNSSATMDESRFSAGNGGNGGAGGTGQIGQRGGTATEETDSAYRGGHGGQGGGGGGGGGGAGGLSIGIMWTGTAPTLNGQLVSNINAIDGITRGKPGAGGPGGVGAAGAEGDAQHQEGMKGEPGQAGQEGIGQAVLGLQAEGSSGP